jgi:glycosyltransferase involved in cell wall biosynthesis
MYTTVIPAHDHVPFLGQAIESVFAQTFAPSQIHVVFNGEGRDFSDAEAQLSRFGSEVTAHYIPQRGQSAAIAHGIKLTQTEFVAFIDADDLWSIEKQASQMEFLHSSDEWDAVAGVVTNFQLTKNMAFKRMKSAKARLFAATTFRLATFYKYGLPGSDHDQFEWLYRWWTQAGDRGIRYTFTSQEVLLRRIHESNTWVTDKDSATPRLFQELRRRNKELNLDSA